MGFFNTLITEINCPNCGKKHEGRIQFKFAFTRQLKYKLGDTIVWNVVNVVGTPDLKKVKAYGIIESQTCPFCHENNIPEE